MVDWEGTAEFSEDGRHRLSLGRRWGNGPRALVCGANPSSAGASRNDPTISWLIKMFEPRGYGGFLMVNWETYIASSPKEMHTWRNCCPIDEHRAAVARNLDIIRTASVQSEMRFVAWGNLVPSIPQTTKVLWALSLGVSEPLYAFGLTKDGKPKHPMARGHHRIPDDWKPVLWRAGPGVSETPATSKADESKGANP